jgi:hypothetical protein
VNIGQNAKVDDLVRHVDGVADFSADHEPTETEQTGQPSVPCERCYQCAPAANLSKQPSWKRPELRLENTDLPAHDIFTTLALHSAFAGPYPSCQIGQHYRTLGRHVALDHSSCQAWAISTFQSQ